MNDPKSKPADDDAASGVTWEKAVAFCEWLTEEGRHDLSPADRGGVGVCLPCGHEDAFSCR